jgi:endonuclease/exonuclease/phosphatase family metal-dependent hydrolase
MNRSLLFVLLLGTCLCYGRTQTGSNPPNQSTDSIVVATWNIGHFAKGRGYRSLIKMDDYPKKAAEFQSFIYDSIAADVLCVNEYSKEFCIDSIRGTVIADDSIFNRFKEIKVFPQNKYVCNAIFSNKKLNQSVMQPFHYDDTDRTETNDRITWYYYLLADISIGGEDVKLVCTHLIANSEKKCQKQIEELIKVCEKYEKIIICGDMNTWNYSKFKDAGYTFANDGSIVTWPAKSYALDNVFVKGLKISNVRVVKTDLSDHYAVVCLVSL